LLYFVQTNLSRAEFGVIDVILCWIEQLPCRAYQSSRRSGVTVYMATNPIEAGAAIAPVLSGDDRRCS
jgi:hypothetical protein